MACLASPNRANARQTPMARTQRGDMLQHNTRWLRTVRKTESSNNFPFFQLNDLRRVWLVRLANDRKAETMQCYMAQRTERVDHACKTLSLASEKHCFGPKMVSEATSLPLNSKNFLGGGGGMPPDPPSCCVLTHAPLT